MNEPNLLHLLGADVVHADNEHLGVLLNELLQCEQENSKMGNERDTQSREFFRMLAALTSSLVKYWVFQVRRSVLTISLYDPTPKGI